MNRVTKFLRTVLQVDFFKNSKKEIISVNKIDNVPLDEKYPGLDPEELYWLLEDKDRDGEILSENEERFLQDEGWVQLGRTLHKESLYGRSLAIKELVEGNYNILTNESQNPFKEIINFVLLFLKGREKNDNFENLITSHFPQMHLYIKREISGQRGTSIPNEPHNPQEAYDEFLMFAKNILVLKYPDETVRNEQIQKNFITLHNSLISFIKLNKS